MRKHIPAAGGLGGGSSDAALALRLLDAVYDLGLPPQQLLQAAAELGSDVPFFLFAGTALVKGRGEQVTPLPDLPEHWLVLLNPGLPLLTARVFQELRPGEYATPSPAAAGEGWGEGTRRSGQALPPLVNTLEAPALRLEPAIADCRRRLQAAGARQVLLSGSGPTVFGLTAGEADARRIASQTGGMPARFVPRPEALALSPRAGSP